MKKDRVSKVCQVCGESFEVIRCREDKAKYCSRKCYDIAQCEKTPWNKGKTIDELFEPDRAAALHQKFRELAEGKSNPMFGRSHSTSARKKMSDAKEGYVPWIKGKKLPGLYKNRKHTGEHNAYIKFVMRTEGITYREYISRLSEQERYYREVMNITRLQPVHLLENYNKRARGPNESAYHLDHVYPIKQGFENKIPPTIIGDISNLQFIPWKNNLTKSDKLLEEAKKVLYENCIYDGIARSGSIPQ